MLHYTCRITYIERDEIISASDELYKEILIYY